jgi:putative phosphoesterase
MAWVLAVWLGAMITRTIAGDRGVKAMVFRVGIISDTHGLLRPEALHGLAGVDHIIHGGDIGRPEVMAGLRRIAPVTAIRGNVDTAEWAKDYPETATVRLRDRSFYILHDLNALSIDPVALGIDAVISGHSHQVKIATIGGVLYLNPGSAGPRRFKLPITLATLELVPGDLKPVIHDLTERCSDMTQIAGAGKPRLQRD